MSHARLTSACQIECCKKDKKKKKFTLLIVAYTTSGAEQTLKAWFSSNFSLEEFRSFIDQATLVSRSRKLYIFKSKFEKSASKLD